MLFVSSLDGLATFMNKSKGCVYTVPDHFLLDTEVFLFPRFYTVPVQFRSSAGAELFLFPSRYKTLPDSRYKVVPDHLT